MQRYSCEANHSGNANPERPLVTKNHPVIEYNSASPLRGSIHAAEACNGAESGRTAQFSFPAQKASTSTLPAAERFMSGDHSAETLAELRRCVATWIMSDGTLGLHRVLGLGTPRSARLRLRDSLLRDAARLLDGTAWDKARALATAASSFESRRWPRWRYTGVPDTACRLDTLLYDARKLGALPTTARQFFNVLSGE